jgi:hypothetical protein
MVTVTPLGTGKTFLPVRDTRIVAVCASVM